MLPYVFLRDVIVTNYKHGIRFAVANCIADDVYVRVTRAANPSTLRVPGSRARCSRRSSMQGGCTTLGALVIVSPVVALALRAGW